MERKWLHSLGGIRKKILRFVLASILAMAGVCIASVIWESGRLQRLFEETNEQQRAAVTDQVEIAMDERLTHDLTTSTKLQSYISASMFTDVSDAIQFLWRSTQDLFDDPADNFDEPDMPAAPPDASTDGAPSVQLLCEPGVDLNDPAVAADVALLNNMSDKLVYLYNATEIDSIYIALPSGVMLLVDDHASTKIGPDGAPVPFEMTKRPWYTDAAKQGALCVTDVETDVFTGNAGLMLSMPVFVDGKVAAVVGADLLINNMANYLKLNEGADDFTCIINGQGHVVFSTATQGTFKVAEAHNPVDIRTVQEDLADFIDDATDGLTDPVTIQFDDHIWHLCGSSIADSSWIVINGVDQVVVDSLTHNLSAQFDGLLDEALNTFNSTTTSVTFMLVVLLAIVAGVALIAVYRRSNHIVAPLEKITDKVRSLKGGNLVFEMEDEFRTGDEVEDLAEAFALLSAKLIEHVEEVKRVTASAAQMKAELNVAAAIQSSQLPSTFPPFPERDEFDIYAIMDPAREVGGDFYDFYFIDDDRFAMVIADVSSKGIPASLFMMVSRLLIKSHLQSGESLADALMATNDQLCQNNKAQYFVTVWAAVIDLKTGSGVAANAGHEHPALCRAGGAYELVVYRHSMVLGMMDGIPFREHTFELRPGDTVFVYTDGVPEATDANNELYGNDRMVEALNLDPATDPLTTIERVKDSVEAFVGEAEQFDDITMLCFRYLGPGSTDSQ